MPTLRITEYISEDSLKGNPGIPGGQLTSKPTCSKPCGALATSAFFLRNSAAATFEADWPDHAPCVDFDRVRPASGSGTLQRWRVQLLHAARELVANSDT